MSYAMASALQAAVFTHLDADTTLEILVGSAIFDVAPSGGLPGLYVMLGPETVRDRSDGTGAGAEHEFVISVVSDADGFHTAKTVAAAVSDALVDAHLSLTRGRLVGLNFRSAQAMRVAKGTQRQIDLRFRARVEDN
ncbi:MAG: DUF3168 domain-containing protein [Rhodobacteraceae bacterium]|nr:DUF3168 domain-containing protein [Paracoccaceae bacterium]